MPGRGKQRLSTTAAPKSLGGDHSYTQASRNTSTPVEDESDQELTPFKCRECEKMIYTRDEPVECDFCENAYCFKCYKVPTKDAYKRLGSSKEEDGTMWFCLHCRCSFPGVRKMVCRVTKLEDVQEDLCKKQDEMGKRLESLENTDIDTKVKEALMEQKERENRKLNIMCFGLPESDKDTPEGRNTDDLNRLNHIFSDVMEIDDHDGILKGKPIRVGQLSENKCRPIRLLIDSMDSKKRILEAART